MKEDDTLTAELQIAAKYVGVAADLAELLAQAGAVLAECEWAGMVYGAERKTIWQCCPVCKSTNVGMRGAVGSGENGVHEEGCRLDALLRLLPIGEGSPETGEGGRGDG